jgi:cytochrome c553
VSPLAVVAAIAVAAWLPGIAQAAGGEPASDPGEGIYLRGVAVSGRPIVASRSEGSKLEGSAAACANCHQRSGLGGHEGRSAIPPVAARYLLRPSDRQGGERDLPFVEGMRNDHRPPYDDATLARAIREGVDSNGTPLNYLMPRYDLSGDDMAALIGHLRKLDHRRVPGVTESTLHFATIITPDADPVKRRGMLEVIKQFFADRNVRQMVPAPPMLSSGRTAYAKSMFMVHRRWELHVWELSGPDSTWPQQLDRHLAAEPVFAVVSGLGGRNWAPVHSFCERAGLPCLFPNVEVPVDRQSDFYSLYFSKGVLLEADLIARALADPGDARPPRKVVQIYRAGDSGEVAAAALTERLGRQGLSASNLALASNAVGRDVEKAVRSVADADGLVLWLRAADLAALGETAPPSQAVYVSGLLGGLERAPLPKDWRHHVRLVYPFDLPDRRRVRVDYPLGWFRARHIPVVDEQVQTDTYLACSLVSETLNHMAGTFVRDYLVERTETMLEHRIVTGYYPRLALATHERFASKGGYLVSWPEPAGARIAPIGGWTVP